LLCRGKSKIKDVSAFSMKAYRGREVLFHSSLMSASDSGGEQLHPLDTLPPTVKVPTIIGGPQR